MRVTIEPHLRYFIAFGKNLCVAMQNYKSLIHTAFKLKSYCQEKLLNFTKKKFEDQKSEYFVVSKIMNSIQFPRMRDQGNGTCRPGSTIYSANHQC